MGNSTGNLNQNDPHSVNTSNNNTATATSNIKSKTVYDTSTTVNLLKALFENEKYSFTSFSSKDHGELVKKTIENSRQQDSMNSMQLTGDPALNEFVNYLHTNFNDFLSTNDINNPSNGGMIKYEIYSIQSLNSTTNVNKAKSIWLPKSMTVSEAHRILSTILYSSNIDTIPVDLADYVLVYENIMISLENQGKELYEEILKISFRLNRIVLSPFRLLIIHKSQLLLLERKESKPILSDNESISILQLIMFHLIAGSIHQSENESERATAVSGAGDKDQNHQYWPIIETKMGIIPSSDLIHPLKYSKLSKALAKIIQANRFPIRATDDMESYLKILEMVFMSVNANVSYINSIISSLSKQIQIYDYPLLVALPYDRLLLSQFCKIQSSDGRWARGIMVNGKYYRWATYPYTSMSELKINRGSIIHLRFNLEFDTILNGNLSSSQANDIKMSKCYKEVPDVNKDEFPPTKYQCSVECDNGTVYLMFPSPAVDTIRLSEQLERKSGSQTKTADQSDTKLNHLELKLKAFNNWAKVPTEVDDLEKQMNKSNIETTNPTQEEPCQNESSNQDMSTNDYNLTQAINTSFSSATLINKASTFSLPLIDKPECSNCLSHLNDNNLECPHCTQVFCQLCIESSYDDVTRDRCCPKCHNPVELSAYRKSTIIEKFEKEGISAFECLICKSIPEDHRLCLDSKCSALFCYNCCKKEYTPTASNPSKMIKCPQCKKADTYVSGAVRYYTVRITEYQCAQDSESKSSESSNNKQFPNTVWKEEDFLPEKGTFEENHNRIISVIQFNGDHIKFSNKKENCPLLVINEPPEYICPESLRMSYWKAENGINRWEDDKKVQFHTYNNSSVAAYIPHFTEFTARNIRFQEHIILDEAFLDKKYDYDFTTVNDNGKSFQRGPEPYKRPCGWYRKAIRVLGVYENSAWLGKDRDAWPVAYHGTATANALSILRNGLVAGGSNGTRIANGTRYGSGIYLSPNPLFSDRPNYAVPLDVDGRRYQIMFQVRIKPSSIRKGNVDIWICGSSQDIRPYGILFKEIESAIGR